MTQSGSDNQDLAQQENSHDETLQLAQLAHSKPPFELFHDWFEQAKQKEINDPNAMALATVDEEGLPNVRMVLLKDVTETGFTFYTNYKSAKGQEILSTSKAALCFHWKSLRKQVRVRGLVEQVSVEEADAYFASRSRGSRIGAWASQQSRELEGRYALEKAVAKYTTKFAVGSIPRPDYWSGFTIKPLEIEFWQDRKYRLHDRFIFKRETFDQSWSKFQLYP